MGYSMFARRKIYYTNLMFLLNSQLDNIMQQKNSLLSFSANISDGKVTVEEIAGDPANFNNYSEFLQGADAYINTPDDEGGAATSIGEIGSIAATQNNNQEYLAAVAEMLNQSVNQEYANQYCKRLEAYENQLDMQQQRIESKLTAVEKQYESVKEAEGQAIERSTPKFNGVG